MTGERGLPGPPGPPGVCNCPPWGGGTVGGGGGGSGGTGGNVIFYPPGWGGNWGPRDRTLSTIQNRGTPGLPGSSPTTVRAKNDFPPNTIVVIGPNGEAIPLTTLTSLAASNPGITEVIPSTVRSVAETPAVSSETTTPSTSDYNQWRREVLLGENNSSTNKNSIDYASSTTNKPTDAAGKEKFQFQKDNQYNTIYGDNSLEELQRELEELQKKIENKLNPASPRSGQQVAYIFK